MASIPTAHPAWCDRQHNEDYPAHTAEVGDQDVEVSIDTELSVSLYQQAGEPAQVWLCEHRRNNTAVTQLTPAQARELGERLIQAAGSVGNGVLHPLTAEHTNSGP